MEMRNSKPPGTLGSEGASNNHSKLNVKIEDKTEISGYETDETAQRTDHSDLSESSADEREDDEAHPSGGIDGPPIEGTARALENKWQLPIDNIVVLVLASWEMRLPVIYMDFVR